MKKLCLPDDLSLDKVAFLISVAALPSTWGKSILLLVYNVLLFFNIFSPTENCLSITTCLLLDLKLEGVILYFFLAWRKNFGPIDTNRAAVSELFQSLVLEVAVFVVDSSSGLIVAQMQPDRVLAGMHIFPTKTSAWYSIPMLRLYNMYFALLTDSLSTHVG